MRKKIVAGNWKMNKSFPEGMQLIDDILNVAAADPAVIKVIAPPFIHLAEDWRHKIVITWPRGLIPVR